MPTIIHYTMIYNCGIFVKPSVYKHIHFPNMCFPISRNPDCTVEESFKGSTGLCTIALLEWDNGGCLPKLIYYIWAHSGKSRSEDFIWYTGELRIFSNSDIFCPRFCSEGGSSVSNSGVSFVGQERDLPNWNPGKVHEAEDYCQEWTN